MDVITKEQMKRTGEVLKNARTLKRLRQIDVAELIDISSVHYAGIEQGRRKMSIDLAIKVSEELDISLDLMYMSDKEQKGYVKDEFARIIIECINKNESNMNQLIEFALFLIAKGKHRQ